MAEDFIERLDYPSSSFCLEAVLRLLHAPKGSKGNIVLMMMWSVLDIQYISDVSPRIYWPLLLVLGSIQWYLVAYLGAVAWRHLQRRGTRGKRDGFPLARGGDIGLLVLPFCLLAAPGGAETVEYCHTDAVGNVRVVTDESGAVIERHDYLPFGEECTTVTEHFELTS